MMSDQALWFLNRGTGVVLQVLFSLVVLLGIIARRSSAGRGLPRFVTHRLHTRLTLLSMVFLGVHVASAVFDSYVSLTILDAVWPFGATYKPLWLGLGALALDLTLALAMSGLLRRWFSDAAWHLLHAVSYLAWAAAIVHGIGIGTDRHTPWLLAITIGCCVVVIVAWLVATIRDLRRTASA